jgi:hypothetical protein
MLTSSSIHLSIGRSGLEHMWVVAAKRTKSGATVTGRGRISRKLCAVQRQVIPDYKHQIRMYTIIRSSPSSIVFKIHQCYHDSDNDNDNDKENSNRSYIINTIHHLQKEVKNVYEQNSN